jgi:hypothetical protein
MQALIVIVLCAAAGVIYVIYCVRKDRRVERELQVVVTTLSPGPKVREMTTMRPNPMRSRSLASGSQPTFTPAEVDSAVLGRADTELHHATPACAGAPSHDTFSGGHHDACSTHDSSYGEGFDGGGHRGG